MKHIQFGTYSGAENMRIDEEILEESIATQSQEEIFRLYAWEPACVSLGKNQSDEFIDTKLLKELNIDCVRRQTGGRALLHDKELTYSYVAPVSIIPNGQNITESYLYISNILIKGFEKLGINLTIGGCPRHITKNNYCMSVSTGADLCWNNRKFIGSAQCRKQGYVLQHGSILFDYDKDLIDKLFAEKTDFETIVTLKEINPDLTIEDVIEVFE